MSKVTLKNTTKSSFVFGGGVVLEPMAEQQFEESFLDERADGITPFVESGAIIVVPPVDVTPPAPVEPPSAS